MIKIKQFIFNPFRENTYLLYDHTGSCAIVDAGCYETKEEFRLKDFIEKEGLIPKILINTHGHIDHTLGAQFVRKTWHIPLSVHSSDAYLINNMLQQGRMFGFDATPVSGAEIALEERTTLTFGETELHLIFTPGHTPGGVCLHLPEEKILFTGDTLFAGSIGRTDLPGGDYDQLMDSLHQRLLSLPPDTRVYPGHGSATTLGDELAGNPFLLRLGNQENYV